MTDRQTTRAKDAIFKFDAMPAGVYDLDYRQAPVLTPLGWPVASAALASACVGLLAAPAKDALAAAASCGLVVLGAAAGVAAGEAVAGVAVRWLTADHRVPTEALRRNRAAWAGRWKLGLNSEHGTAVGRILLVAGAVAGAAHLVGFAAPVAAGLALWPALVLSLGLLGWHAGGSPSRTLWYLRLALTGPPTEPTHPCVLVPSPRAERVWVLFGLAVVLVAFGLALFPWTLTRLRPPTIDGSGAFVVTALQVAVRFGGVFLAPAAVTVAAVYAVAGPAIERHHARLAPPYGTECDTTRTQFDGYDDRLRNSRNAVERGTFFHGVHPTLDLPILIDEKHLFEHSHVLGPTGIGKTVLGLMGRVMQHIRRDNSAVLILDGKGDEALFGLARAEAAKAGRVFKHFTTAVGKSTHVFNPLDARILGAMTVGQKVGVLQNALGLVHGEDYGRGFFTLIGNTLLRRAFHLTGGSAASAGKGQKSPSFDIRSFGDLSAAIRRVIPENKAFEAGEQTAFLVEKLAELEQLNLAEAPGLPADHPVLKAAISFPDVIREKQVIYMSLVGAIDPGPTAEIARLAIYSLMAACESHKAETGRVAPTHVICDEDQMIIGRPVAALLATARSYGVSFTLSHQTLSQLVQPGGTDIREIVLGCTATKVVFGSRDAFSQKWVRDSSGLTRAVDYSYQATLDDVLAGEADIENTAPDDYGRHLVQARESMVPRVNIQDIMEVSNDPNLCLTTLEVGRGLGQTVGPYPVRVEWPMSEEQYEAYKAAPWPEATPETLVIRPGHPARVEETLPADGATPHTPGAARKQLTDIRARP